MLTDASFNSPSNCPTFSLFTHDFNLNLIKNFPIVSEFRRIIIFVILVMAPSFKVLFSDEINTCFHSFDPIKYIISRFSFSFH